MQKSTNKHTMNNDDIKAHYAAIEAAFPNEELQAIHDKAVEMVKSNINQQDVQYEKVSQVLFVYPYEKEKPPYIFALLDAFYDDETREKSRTMVTEQLIKEDIHIKAATLVSEVWIGTAQKDDPDSIKKAMEEKNSHKVEGAMIATMSLDLRAVTNIHTIHRTPSGHITIGERSQEYPLHRLSKDEILHSYLAKLFIEYITTKAKKGKL